MDFRPPSASVFADQVDAMFMVLTGLTFFFSGLVIALLIFFSLRYRRGRKVDRSRPVHTDLRLELTWSVIPLVIGLAMFVWAAIPYANVYKPPDNAYTILVIGKRWMWHMQHPNGLRENYDLHVPTGRDIKLTMISQDVLHDFYVPAFRVKRDVVPGRYTTVWFRATRPGKYHLFCAEYCGMGHSEMGGWVYVMKPEEFADWMKTGGVKTDSKLQTPAEKGRELYARDNCGSCHSNATNHKGPSLVGIYKTGRKMLDGSTMIADDDYLRGAIREPERYPLQGYPVNLMPSYKGQFTEEQIFELIAYIKSLKPGSVIYNGSEYENSEGETGDAPNTGGSGNAAPSGKDNNPSLPNAPTAPGGQPNPAPPGKGNLTERAGTTTGNISPAPTGGSNNNRSNTSGSPTGTTTGNAR